MTNKYKYFVANWKMFGDIKTVNSINKVIKINKSGGSKAYNVIKFYLLSNFADDAGTRELLLLLICCFAETIST